MSEIQIHEVDQGSPEWHGLRAGCITASEFQSFLDLAKTGPNKGGYKKAAHDYAFRLACERISGKPLDEGFETWAMRRGHELEPEARAEHGVRINQQVEVAGFVRTVDGKFGASADGLIGDDGGAEYKCLIDPARMRSIIIDSDIAEFMPQVHVGMWLTGRQWWHFCLYCPALEDAGKQLTIFEVKRDDDEIERIERAALEFDGLVEEYREAIMGHRDYVRAISDKEAA